MKKTECPFPGRVPWAGIKQAFGLQTKVLRRPHPYRPARGRRKSRDSHHPAADTATSFIAPRADANGVIHTSPWATPRVHPPKTNRSAESATHHLSIPSVQLASEGSIEASCGSSMESSKGRWAKSRSSPLVCNDQRRMERTGLGIHRGGTILAMSRAFSAHSVFGTMNPGVARGWYE